MTGTNTIQIGRHRASFEPPDLIVLRWKGAVSADDMRGMFDAIERFAALNPNFLLLNDLSESAIPEQDARRAAAHDPRANLLRTMVVVGASFHVRVVATMLYKAMKLVGNSNQITWEFIAGEPEGRAWLDEQRRKRQAQGVV